MSISMISSVTTCIVGGGNSAHVLISLLSEAGHRVNLLTRRPHDWQDVVYCEVTDGVTNKVVATHAGNIHKRSSDPVDVIPDADIIILCMPVHQYRQALDRLGPYINREKEVYVGTVSRKCRQSVTSSGTKEQHNSSCFNNLADIWTGWFQLDGTFNGKRQ